MVEAHRQRAPQISVASTAPVVTPIPPPVLPPAAARGTASANPPPAGSAPAKPPSAAPPSGQQTRNPPAAPPPGITSPSNVFRAGELVWFRQTAWRLGLVLATRPKAAGQARADNDYDFTLAPLGHALLQQQNVIKDANDMRPFLTFSVPNTTVEELQEKPFENIDWEEFAPRYANSPDQQTRSVKLQMVGLEASKIAARCINDSFSTFNRLGESFTADHMYKIQSFTGVYLGAEMVCISDPLRVTAPANPEAATDSSQPTTAVMLVSEIQLITPAWPGNDPSATAAATSLQFRGNIYRTVRAPIPHPTSFVAPAALGPAFEHEIGGRNGIERDKKFAWGWMLIERDAVRSEAEVQGRFYVTHKLMSIIDLPRLKNAATRGVIEEAQAYLNNRSHSGFCGRTIGLRPGRAASVGKAVATQFVVPLGLVED